MTHSKTTRSATHWLPRSLLASALLVFGVFLVVPPATVEAQTAPAAYAAAKNDPETTKFPVSHAQRRRLAQPPNRLIYAESYLGWAAEDGNVGHSRSEHLPGPLRRRTGRACRSVPRWSEDTSALVDPMVDALSTRNFRLREESGHNQFFATFARFAEASFGRRGEMLAEVTHRAGRQNIVYLELTKPRHA